MSRGRHRPTGQRRARPSLSAPDAQLVSDDATLPLSPQPAAPATSAGGGAGMLLAGRIGGVAGSLIASQALIGLTYVLAARGMAPADLGRVTLCLAVGTVAATAFDLGTAPYLVREVAAGHATIQNARGLLRTKRRVTPLLILPPMLAGMLIMPRLLDGLVIGAFGWLLWESQNANSLLRAQERFSRAVSAQLSGRVLGLVTTAVLLSVLTSAPELALAIGLTLGFAAEATLARAFLGACGAAGATLHDLARVQRRSVSFGFVSLAAVGQQLDIPLVSAGAGLTEGGIYGAATRLIGPLLFLSTALALVGAPWLARSQKDPAALRAKERRVLLWAGALALGPLTAVAVGPVLIPWVLGDQYADSGTVFSLLAVGGALATVGQGIGSILQNRGAERSVGTAIAVGLSLGLATTFGLAVVGGATSAAAGFVLGQLCIVAYLAVTLRVMRRRASVADHGSGSPASAASRRRSE